MSTYAMRLQLFCLALFLLPLAAATSYTVYSDGGNISPNTNVTLEITTFLGNVRTAIDGSVTALQHARDANDATQVTAATEALESALLNAKTNDRLLVSSPWKNLLLHYKECGDTGTYHICFTEITYPEEDGPPLGGSSYSQVKFVNGTYNLPITLTVTELQQAMLATRSLNTTTAYPGDTVSVKLDVANTGNLPIDAVTVTDTSPLHVLSGDTHAFIGALLPDADLLASYIVTVDTPGTYVFSGSVQPSGSLSDSTLVVLDPQNFTITATNATSGADGNVTVTLTNMYLTDIMVTGLQLSTNEAFTDVFNAPSSKHPGHSAFSFDQFTIPKDGNITFTVTYTTVAPGTASFTANAHVNVPVERSLQASASAAVIEPGANLAITLDGRTATLTLTNTAPTPLTNVVIDWGTTTQDTIQSLATTDFRRNTYTTGGNYTVTVTYLLGKLSRTRTATVVIAQNATVALNVTTNVTASPNVTEQPSTPPAAAPSPVTPPVVAPANSTKEPSKSWITSFLDWLQGIFG